MNLIADIGGTNARLALAGAEGPDLSTLRSYRNADFASFDAVLTRYLADLGPPFLTAMVVAVAGPVRGTRARLTNRDWHFHDATLAERFGIEKVRLINDLTALGHAATRLDPSALTPLVTAEAPPDQQALVVGIGTGFNVSPVIPDGPRITCPSVEAGHVSLPGSVLRQITAHAPQVGDPYPTVEDLFSGRGFQDLLARVTGDSTGEEPSHGEDLVVQRHGELVGADAADLLARYGTPGTETASAAIDLYAQLIGLLLRDLTLAHLATGGLYLAGGVARGILSSPAAQHCEAILRQPSRFYDRQPPAWIITDDAAALIGCAGVAAQL